MALAHQLPIYRKTNELIVEFIRRYENIRNLHKYRIGAYVYDNLIRLPWYIKKANRCAGCVNDRNAFIEDYLDELENIGNALRNCYDTRIIDARTHARLAELIVELGRQANAWKRYKVGASAGRPADGDTDIKGRTVETRTCGTT